MRLRFWRRVPQPTLCDYMRALYGTETTADIRYQRADPRKLALRVDAKGRRLGESFLSRFRRSA